MKLKLIVTLGLLISINSFGQLKLKEIVTTNTVINERIIKLNGGFRSAFGGSSRIIIPISLPPNTIEWYYSVTTISDKGNFSEKLNLAVQIAAAVAATTTTAGKVAAFIGLDQAVVQALKIPQGSVPIDVHVLSVAEANNFINKKEPVVSMNSAERITQALVRLNSPLTKRGIWYIGLRNLSTTNAVQVKIEVVAITSEKKWVSE